MPSSRDNQQQNGSEKDLDPEDLRREESAGGEMLILMIMIFKHQNRYLGTKLSKSPKIGTFQDCFQEVSILVSFQA